MCPSPRIFSLHNSLSFQTIITHLFQHLCQHLLQCLSYPVKPVRNTIPWADTIRSPQCDRQHFSTPSPAPSAPTPTLPPAITTTTMASEILPRFLLPRLSWQPIRQTRPAFRVQPFQYHQRAFHATTLHSRDHHFDTLKFVKRLQGEGFTEEQSVAMMKVLNDVIEERCVPSTFP